MRTFSNMIKPWDIIITLLLVLLSFLPIVIFSYQQAERTADIAETGVPQTVAVITVNNEEVRRVTLTGNTEDEVFDIFTG